MRKGKKVVSGRGTLERDEWPVGCKELQKFRYYLGSKSKVSMRSESRKPNREPVHENSLRWTKEHGLIPLEAGSHSYGFREMALVQ